MEPLVFSIGGLPRGKGRPRVDTRGSFARVYTDAKTAKFEREVAKIAALAMRGRTPFAGPLSVSLRFRMPIPKSAPKRQRLAMAAGETPHVGRPDLDNMVKAALDAMGAHKDRKTGLWIPVVFVNDCQIVRLFSQKVYADNPGIDVRVEPLGEPVSEAEAA